MNKKIKILILLIIMLVMPFCVLAETTEKVETETTENIETETTENSKVSISGTKIVNVMIPENWKIVTKENINEMMDWLGLDSAKKMTYKYNFYNNSYYADIVKDTKDIHIILTVKESPIDYEDISIYQYDLKDIEKQIKNSYIGKDISISNYKTSSGIKYYVVNYQDENNMNVIDIITTIHGNMYLYTVKSSTEIEESVKTSFMDIVNSVEYEDYLNFIEENKIELEEKKDNSVLILIVILTVIIVVGVVIYILVSKIKKKKNNNKNIQPQAYNPVNVDTKNPAVADFLETADLENNKNNSNPSVADFLNQDGNKKG